MSAGPGRWDKLLNKIGLRLKQIPEIGAFSEEIIEK